MVDAPDEENHVRKYCARARPSGNDAFHFARKVLKYFRMRRSIGNCTARPHTNQHELMLVWPHSRGTAKWFKNAWKWVLTVLSDKARGSLKYVDTFSFVSTRNMRCIKKLDRVLPAAPHAVLRPTPSVNLSVAYRRAIRGVPEKQRLAQPIEQECSCSVGEELIDDHTQFIHLALPSLVEKQR